MKTRLAVALMGLLAHLPLPLLRGLGWLLGRLLFVLAAPRRKVALRNLALCFPEVPEAQRQALIHQWGPPPGDFLVWRDDAGRRFGDFADDRGVPACRMAAHGAEHLIGPVAGDDSDELPFVGQVERIEAENGEQGRCVHQRILPRRARTSQIVTRPSSFPLSTTGRMFRSR